LKEVLHAVVPLDRAQRVLWLIDLGLAMTVSGREGYATLLKANGEDVKVVQESLRHANSRIALDIYTQAPTPAKRQAQSKVVQMIRPDALGAIGIC
jgi:integrase